MTRKQLEVLGTMIVVTVLSGCGPDDGADAEDVDVVTGEATKWYCGSQCNEKAPNWVVPSNGVQCSRSAVHLGSPGFWSSNEFEQPSRYVYDRPRILFDGL